MIALARAYLCLDESIVFDRTEGQACPQCGSAIIWPIARWLDRPAPTPPSGALVISPLELIALTEGQG